MVENIEFDPELPFNEIVLAAPPAPIVIGIDAPQTGNDVQYEVLLHLHLHLFLHLHLLHLLLLQQKLI